MSSLSAAPSSWADSLIDLRSKAISTTARNARLFLATKEAGTAVTKDGSRAEITGNKAEITGSKVAAEARSPAS